jgi:hypothetical protein
MRKQVSAKQSVVRGQTSHITGFWLLVLLLALVGMFVAALSQEPTLWMLRWPAPLVVVFTVVNFIRQGFHKRDGLLVLGRAGRSESGRSVNTGNERERAGANGNGRGPLQQDVPNPQIEQSPTRERATERQFVFPRVPRPRAAGFRVA